MNRILLKKIGTLFVLSAVFVGCDQSTKYTARQLLDGQPAMRFMGDFFRLSYAENSGGFLSLGAGLPEDIRRAVFIVLVSLFIMGFLLFVIYSQESDSLFVISSGLIIGGGIGNLIDRIVNQGAVIDFMNIGMGALRTGIFNVADVAIMAGVFMFAIRSAFKSHNRVSTPSRN